MGELLSQGEGECTRQKHQLQKVFVALFLIYNVSMLKILCSNKTMSVFAFTCTDIILYYTISGSGKYVTEKYIEVTFNHFCIYV